jgi:hypothetical protein
MTVIQGQQTYNQFPAFAQPGQIADLSYAEIASYPASEVINPGRLLMLYSDGLSVMQAQSTADTQLTTKLMGVSCLITARESSGAFGITAYGVGGPQYNIGDSVPVLQRGRIFAEWKGTTQLAYSVAMNVYCSSTTGGDLADRGKVTDASVSTSTGSEVALIGVGVRTREVLPNSGNIVLIDVNLPGAVS